MAGRCASKSIRGCRTCLALSTPAAARLGVRRLPFAQARVSVDGGGGIEWPHRAPAASLRGRQRSARNIAGIFGVPAARAPMASSARASLPYDIITLRLRADAAVTRDIVLPLGRCRPVVHASASRRRNTARVVRRCNNDAQHSQSPRGAFVRSRRRYSVASGELVERPLILGLSSADATGHHRTHRSRPSARVAYARTISPLLGALEEDAIVAEGEASDTPPSLTIGRVALQQAGCSSISVNRRTRQLTLRCAA
jgi:hypothetical protein